MAEDVASDYERTLKELTFNSKLHINVLTIIAGDNKDYAENIVNVIENHIKKAPAKEKLPVLYLMDSIMKNLKDANYASIFSSNIVDTFEHVFQQVCIVLVQLKHYDCNIRIWAYFTGYPVIICFFLTWKLLVFKAEEKTRGSMFKLRQTWQDMFPTDVLYALDCKVKKVDPAWPITAQKKSKPKQPVSVQSIHVNPKFIKQVSQVVIRFQFSCD